MPDGRRRTCPGNSIGEQRRSANCGSLFRSGYEQRVSPGRDGLANGPVADIRPAADPAMEAIVALRSEDPRRILSALRIGASSSALVGHMIPLLWIEW
jgi:hypothetical protein